jgi:thiosulfate/3-mercaptopyruvate sulfurtransferase
MTATTTETPRSTDVLVDADWLEAHLDDPTINVIEVDVSAAAHAAGHIPGAVLWNIYTDLRDEGYRLQPTERIRQLIRASGITAGSTVVFYGYAPALGFWLLTHFGHGEVKILNTSRDTWLAASRPWTTEPTRPRATSYTGGAANRAIRAGLADVAAAAESEHEVILDVRSDLEYRGERFWPSGGSPEGGRAGRIPTATHLPVGELLGPDGSFLTRDEIGDIPARVEALGTQRLTTYCTVGARAATVWFVLTYLLGRSNVRVYDGSWAEWGLSPATAVER